MMVLNAQFLLRRRLTCDFIPNRDARSLRLDHFAHSAKTFSDTPVLEPFYEPFYVLEKYVWLARAAKKKYFAINDEDPEKCVLARFIYQ